MALEEAKDMADRPLDPGGPSYGIVQQISNQVARDVDRLHTLLSAASRCNDEKCTERTSETPQTSWTNGTGTR